MQELLEDGKSLTGHLTRCCEAPLVRLQAQCLQECQSCLFASFQSQQEVLQDLTSAATHHLGTAGHWREACGALQLGNRWAGQIQMGSCGSAG